MHAVWPHPRPQAIKIAPKAIPPPNSPARVPHPLCQAVACSATVPDGETLCQGKGWQDGLA